MNFPQLERLNSLPAEYAPYDFSNTVLIAIQHLLGTNGSIFELLNSLGLPYDQMHLLGKVYSTNEAVYHELKSRGVRLHPASMHIGTVQLKTDYKLSLATWGNELLTKAIAKLEHLQTPKTLLVVDDGGVLISLVNERATEINARIMAVEQTRSGAETLRTISNLTFPVVNVAESATKLKDESPYIAASIIEHLLIRMARLLDAKAMRDSNVLVVGHGAIGKNVAKQLLPLAKTVTIHDVADQKGDFTIIKDLEQAVLNKDVIIGCVGKSWLPQDFHAMVKNGVILASGSSSNSEFLGLRIDSDQPIEPSVSFGCNDLTKAHSEYAFNNGKGWILNAGFPINFDGSIHVIPPPTIELTRLLMLSGILQTVTEAVKPGLQELIIKF